MTEMFGVPESQPSGTGPVGASRTSTASGSGGSGSTTDTAKEQASGVAHEGVEGGKHVASVATGQAKQVASEAGQQAQALMAEAKSELMDHASSQQKRVAEQLHGLSQELSLMASKSEQDGLATSLAQQASQQISTVANWVSDREPGSLVTELKDFARNKPGMFLAVAGGVGLLAGRMTRGAKAGAPDQDTAPASSLTSGNAIAAPAWEAPAATPSAMAVDPMAGHPTTGTPEYPGGGELVEPYPSRPGMAP